MGKRGGGGGAVVGVVWDLLFRGGGLGGEGQEAVWMCGALVLLAAWLYGPLRGYEDPNVYDDSALYLNGVVTGELGVWESLQTDFWGKNMSAPDSHRSWRPATVLVARWLYSLAPADPRALRFVSLLFYAFSALLLFALALLLHLPPFLALLAASIFVVHPSHVETLAQSVGSADVLAGFCLLLALTGGVWMHRHQSQHPHSKKLWPLFWGLLAVACVAMLFKEQGVVATAMLGGLELVFRTSGRESVVRFGSCVVGGVGMLWVRFLVMPGPPQFPTHMNPGVMAPDRHARVLSSLYAAARHLFMLTGMDALNSDWSGTAIPPITHWSDDRAKFSILLLTLTTPLLLIPVYHTLTPPSSSPASSSPPPPTPAPRSLPLPNKLTLLLALLLLPYLPASNLFFPVGYPIADRALYLPVAALGLLVAVALDELRKKGVGAEVKVKEEEEGGVAGRKWKWGMGRYLVGVVVVVVWAVSAIRRSRVYLMAWETDCALQFHSVHVAPLQTKGWHSMGSCREHTGARGELRKDQKDRRRDARGGMEALLAVPLPVLNGTACSRKWYLPVTRYAHPGLASACMEWQGVKETWDTEVKRAASRTYPPSFPPPPDSAAIESLAPFYPRSFPPSTPHTDVLDWAMCAAALDPCHHQSLAIIGSTLIAFANNPNKAKVNPSFATTATPDIPAANLVLAEAFLSRALQVVEAMEQDGSLQHDLGQDTTAAAIMANLAHVSVRLGASAIEKGIAEDVVGSGMVGEPILASLLALAPEAKTATPVGRMQRADALVVRLTELLYAHERFWELRDIAPQVAQYKLFGLKALPIDAIRYGTPLVAAMKRNHMSACLNHANKAFPILPSHPFVYTAALHCLSLRQDKAQAYALLTKAIPKADPSRPNHPAHDDFELFKSTVGVVDVDSIQSLYTQASQLAPDEATKQAWEAELAAFQPRINAWTQAFKEWYNAQAPEATPTPAPQNKPPPTKSTTKKQPALLDPMGGSRWKEFERLTTGDSTPLSQASLPASRAARIQAEKEEGKDLSDILDTGSLDDLGITFAD